MKWGNAGSPSETVRLAAALLSRLPVRFLETVPMLATPRTASVARNGWVTSEKRSDHQGCGKCWQGNPPQLVRWEAKDYTSIRRNSGSEGGPLPIRTGENRA